MQEIKWLSMKEVYAYFHIGQNTVMKWIKRKECLFIKKAFVVF